MSDATFDMNIGHGIFEELKKLRSEVTSLRDKVEDVEKASKDTWESMRKSLKNISFQSVIQGIDNVSEGLRNAAEPGLKYNAALKELEAMSGITGKKLRELGNMARENAKEFGGDAAKSIETFKLILAQLGPELAQQPKVFNLMARNAEVLAKSMGGDVPGAAAVLSTAVQQYNVDLTNAAKAQEQMTVMMNAMAASANAGSSELPQLQAAVGVAGGAAKRAGLEFEQMLSSLQFLDKANYKSAEGGTALRNVLEQLSKGRFLPEKVQDELRGAGIDISKLADTTVSFTDKLRMLKPIAKDTALIGALFGGPYSGAAQALIATADAQDEMTASIRGTNEAQRYAATMMESDEEKLARWQARVDDMKVSLYNLTGGTIAYLTPLSETVREISAFVPLVTGAKSGIELLRKSTIYQNVATKAASASQLIWNAAMNANPIGLIITGTVAAAAGIYALTRAMKTNTVAAQVQAAVKQKVIEKTVEERTELDLLFGRLKSAKKGSDDYKQALTELNNKYPGIIQKYDLHKGRIEDLNSAYKDLIKNIDKQAELEANKELLVQEKKDELLNKQDGPNIANIAAHWLTGTSAWHESGKESRQKQSQYRKNVASLQKELNAQKTSSQPEATQPEAPVAIPDLEMKQQPADDTEAAIKKQIKLLEEQKSATKIGTKEYYRLAGEITRLKSRLGQKSGSAASGSSSGSGSGGEKRNISVRIERLVENLIIQTSSVKEGAADIKKQVSEALIGAVRDYETAI